MTVLKKYACPIFAAVLFVYMLVRPEMVTNDASKAIKFCLAVIVPSLFANMVIAAYLFPKIINMTKGKYIEAVALAVGLLCGFPTGATLALKLRENGASREAASYINSFSNNASVSFVISFAGAGALRSTKAGLLLVALQIFSSVLCMFIMKWIIKPKKESFLPTLKEISFTEALGIGIKSIVSVCASIVLFSSISSLFSFINQSELFNAVIKGTLEFSEGINLASALLNPQKSILTAFFIGWSGFCVYLQIKAIVSSAVSMKYYVISKVLQGLFMALGMAVFVC